MEESIGLAAVTLILATFSAIIHRPSASARSLRAIWRFFRNPKFRAILASTRVVHAFTVPNIVIPLVLALSTTWNVPVGVAASISLPYPLTQTPECTEIGIANDGSIRMTVSVGSLCGKQSASTVLPGHMVTVFSKLEDISVSFG